MSTLKATTKTITTVYAPTGYGKSTKFIAELAMANPTSRILVVEPRVVNCINIAGTVQQFYPDLTVGYKTGLAHKEERFTPYGTGSINYVTPHIAEAIFRQEIGSFEIVVIDEAHDMSCPSDNLFLIAKKLEVPIYLISATLPTWCSKLATNHIDLSSMWKPLNEGFQITKHKNFDLSNVDSTKDNILVFVPSQNWINGRYSYGKAIDLDFWTKNGFTCHNCFGGGQETPKILRQIKKGTFLQTGQVIFTNNTMSTGVTIPNITKIFDYGLVIKPSTKIKFLEEYDPNKVATPEELEELEKNRCPRIGDGRSRTRYKATPFKIDYSKSSEHSLKNGTLYEDSDSGSYIPETLDILDELQRSGRGGRVCNTDYYCEKTPTFYQDKRRSIEFIDIAITLNVNDYKRLKNFYLKNKMLSLEEIKAYEASVKHRRKGKTLDIWGIGAIAQLQNNAWNKAKECVQEITKAVVRGHGKFEWSKIKRDQRPKSWSCYGSSSDHFIELKIKSLKKFCKKNNLNFETLH